MGDFRGVLAHHITALHKPELCCAALYSDFEQFSKFPRNLHKKGLTTP